MMAKQIIYSKDRINKDYPNHCEIIIRVSKIDNRFISRLYNDSTLTGHKFLNSIKKQYPNLKEEDNIYFYTNQFKTT